jgi:hypothetical protein
MAVSSSEGSHGAPIDPAELGKLLQEANAGNPASIRRIFQRPTDCPFRTAWVDAVVNAAYTRLHDKVTDKFTKCFERLVRRGNIGADEVAGDYLQQFWLAVATDLKRKNEPGSVLEDVLARSPASDGYFINWANNQAIDFIKSLQRQEARKATADVRLQQFRASVAAFIATIGSPPPDRFQPLIPPQLVAFFCCCICEAYGATALVRKKCATALSPLVDDAAENSEWKDGVTTPADRLQAALSDPSSYGDPWGILTLCFTLQEAREARDPEEDSFERQRRIVYIWLDRVGRHVVRRQQLGEDARRILSRLRDPYWLAVHDMKKRVRDSDSGVDPLAVLAWTHVELLGCCSRRDVGWLTVPQAIDELQDTLKKRQLDLPPSLEAWFRTAGAGTLRDEAARRSLDLSQLIDEEQLAREKRDRVRRSTMNSEGASDVN